MNANIFRLVFNKKTGQLVPVAEITTSNGKGSAASSATGVGGAPQSANGKGLLTWSRINAAAAAAFLSIPIMGGWAVAADVLPTQGRVVNGNATVNVNGRVMTVQQLSQVLGVNWQSFSIGAGNTVVFQQPNAASVAINKVVGNNRSDIFGNLQANGQVFLLNPNGVLFSKTAEVSVGGLVASTAADVNKNANGAWVLSGQGTGSVVNQGNIQARDGGYVVLSGGQAINEGNITTPHGTAALAAGDKVALSIDNGALVAIQVDEATLHALAENKGLIQADGGAIYLTAKGRDSLLNTVVNNEGLVQAKTLGLKDGKVVLMADGGDALHSGSIDVSGANVGEKGGAVVIGGNRIGVVGNASVDASGVAGGGRVVIGGDLLGKAGDVAQISLAERTVIGSNTTIRIGSAQGDGGFVETSGKNLSMQGRVEGQSAGKSGEWLIDPTDITISTGASTATNTSNVWDSTASSAVVNNASIESALNAGTNVTVTTAGAGSGGGNITVAANIAKTAGTDATLNLTANQSIALNSGVNITASAGKLNLNLSGSTVLTLNNNTLSTNGGNISAAISNSSSSYPMILSGNNSINVSAGGVASFSVLNTSTQGARIQLGGNLTTAGNVSFSSTASVSNSIAIDMVSANLSVLSGTTTLAGQYTLGIPTRIRDSTLNVTGGTLVLAGGGLYFGNATINGQTNISTTMFTPNGWAAPSVTLNGTTGPINWVAPDYAVLNLYGNLTTAGVVNFGATSNFNAYGINLGGNLVVANGTTTMNVSSAGSYGGSISLASGSSITNTAGGVMNIVGQKGNDSVPNIGLFGTTLTGSATLTGAAIDVSGNNALNGTGGTIILNGTSGVNRWDNTIYRNGLKISGNLITAGTVNLLGTNSNLQPDGAGVWLAGNLTVLNGTTTMTGMAKPSGSSGTMANGTSYSVASTGVVLTSGSSITNTNGGTLAINAGTQTTANGVNSSLDTHTNAASLRGSTLKGNMTLSAGNIVMSGNNTLNSSAGGVLALSASGNRSAVFVMGGNVSTNATVNLTANTAGAQGFNMTGNLAVGAGTVTVTANKSSVLGNVTGAGNLTVNTSGGNANISQTSGSALNMSGNLSLNAGTGHASLTLLANATSSAINVTATSLNLTGLGDLTLGNITASNNLSVDVSSANGSVIQAAGSNLSITGNLALAAGTGNISLSATNNSVGGTLSVSNVSTLNVVSNAALNVGAVSGSGNLDLSTRTGNLTLNGNVASTGGNVTLTAGSASAVAATNVANGAVTGGDVIKGTATSVAAGTGKTVAIYSGNANTASLATLVTNGTSSFNKVYATAPGGGAVNASRALNLFYRVSPTLTITGATAQDKVYDTTNVAMVAGAVTGGIEGDSVATAVLGVFANATAGTGKAIDVSGTIVGALTDSIDKTISGYQFVTAPMGLTANISKAQVTIANVTASNKVYDTTTNASLSSQGDATVRLGSRILPNSTLASTTTYASGYTVSSAGFTNATAGSGKTVNLSTALTDSTNYTLAAGSQSTTTADIAKANVTLSGVTANNKVYDTTTNASLSGNGSATVTLGNATAANGSLATASAYSAGYTVNSAGFNNATAGTGKTVSLSAVLTDSTNYTLAAGSQSTTTADIAKANVTLSGVTANNKVYDTTTNASLSGNGSATVTLGNATAANGTLAAASAYSAGYTVSSTGFNNATAGTGKTVSLSTALTDMTNYTVAVGSQSTTTADIAKANVTLSGVTANNKVYDTTTNASLSGNGSATVTLGNATAADGTLASASAYSAGYTVSSAGFTNATAGTGKTVNLTTVLTDSTNYTVAAGSQSTTTADIAKANVTLSGVTANNKVYDTTTNASISGNGSATVTLGNATAANGSLAAASAYNSGYTATGSFATAVAGSGKTVNLNTALTDSTNYTLAAGTQSTTTADIGKANVTISSVTVNSKVYDTTTNASVNSQGHASVQLGSSSAADGTLDAASNYTAGHTTTASFVNAAAGTGKSVNLSSVLTDTTNYTLAAGTQSTTTADIAKANVTLSGVTANNKVYDTTTNASLSSQGSGTVVLGNATAADGSLASASAFANYTATGTFADKNAGVSKTVNLNVALADTSNFTLANASQTTATANITAKAITLSGAVAADKVYDATNVTNVSGASLTTGAANSTDNKVYSGDVVSLVSTGAYGVLDSKDVGTGKSVTVSGYTLGGGDAINYRLSQPAGLTANVTPASLTVVANNDAKFVTQTDAVGYNGLSYTGFVGGETLATSGVSGGVITRGNPTMETAGSYAGVLTVAGVSSNNYNITTVAGNYTIVPADRLLVRVTNSDTTYGTAANLTVSSAQYMDGNHIISNMSLVSRVGNAYTFSDGAGGQAVFSLGANQASTSGSGNVVVGAYQVGANNVTETSSNFNNNLVVVGALQVAQKALVLSSNGYTKTYDSTATISNVTLTASGSVSGDAVTVSGVGVFESKHAGTHLNYSVASLHVAGADMDNYYVNTRLPISGSGGEITKLNVTAVTGIVGVDKVYDATVNASLNTSAASFTGMLNGDVLNVGAATAAFADKNAGSNKVVSVTGIALGGADAGNYNLLNTTASTTASISKADITAVTGVTAASKVYDGNTQATINTSAASLTGLIAGDALTIASATGTFANKNAGINKVVSVTGMTLGGADASNYNLLSTVMVNTTANISKADISAVTGIKAGNKVYDGGTQATLYTDNAAFSGMVMGDALRVSAATGTFADEAVGNGKAVSISGIVLGGADAGNYNLLSSTASAAANITSANATDSASATGLKAVVPFLLAPDASNSTPVGARLRDLMSARGDAEWVLNTQALEFSHLKRESVTIVGEGIALPPGVPAFGEKER